MAKYNITEKKEKEAHYRTLVNPKLMDEMKERILDIIAYTTYDLEHALGTLEILLIDIGSQRGDHIDGAHDLMILVVHMLPNDGVGIAQLGILGVLAAHKPHFLILIGADALVTLLAILGDDIEMEGLVATWLDVQELI